MNEQDTFVLDDSSRSGGDLTPKAMDDLRTTAMWVSYLGVLGLISTTVVFLVTFYTVFKILGTGLAYGPGFYMGLCFALFFLVFVFFLSILLYQFGAALKNFMTTGKHYDLEEAFEKQKYYWVAGAIAATLLVGFYVLIFFVGVIKGG